MVVTRTELKSPIKEDGDKKAYSLTHHTHYYDSFTYKSEIRLLKCKFSPSKPVRKKGGLQKDMALIDLLSLSEISLKSGFEQLNN